MKKWWIALPLIATLNGCSAEFMKLLAEIPKRSDSDSTSTSAQTVSTSSTAQNVTSSAVPPRTTKTVSSPSAATEPSVTPASVMTTFEDGSQRNKKGTIRAASIQ